MNKRLPIVLVSASLLFASCSRNNATGDVANSDLSGIERVVNEVVITSGTPVTTADLKIEGMSCEMACGASIKKALAKLKGVSATQIVFNEGDELDHAIVTYDAAQLSDADLINTVHGLYDGQYKVLAITITNQVRGEGASTGATNRRTDDDAVSVYAAPADMVLPTIIGLLTRILRN